ncbi:MAG: hypothetical protein V7L25_08725 [Nostoc sp.]|uniref:hypothetical protein n=1 Tax=Nostoc sp. TaxID=1180 RepID=UPI002FF021FF
MEITSIITEILSGADKAAITIITEILSGADKAAITILVKALFEKEIITIGNFTKKKAENLIDAVKRLINKPTLKDIKPEELIEKIEDVEPQTLQPIL